MNRTGSAASAPPAASRFPEGGISMRIDRAAVKTEIKSLIRTARPSVLVASLIVLVVGAVLGGLSTQLVGIPVDNMDTYMSYIQQGDVERAASYLLANTPTPGARLIDLLLNCASIILNLGFLIFLLNTLRGTGAVYGNLLDGFGYWWKVLVLNLVVGVLVALWSLLLIVPGIIAAYRYSMANYLLLTRPELGIMDCIRESKRLTKGRKAELFQLDLSFLGWLLLCLIPVVGWALYVWVCPYRELCQLRYFETYCGAPETWQPEQASRDPWDL